MRDESRRTSLCRGVVAGMIALVVLLVGGYAGTASAQDLIVYPAKGQSPEQQQTDQGECYMWARNSTGFDPMAQPTASTPPPTQEAPQGGLVKGAARGALVGVTVGAIAGDAGKGAAIGAASGGLIGGMRRQDQARSQDAANQQWAQQQAAEYQQKRAGYVRAYTACLEGRGYSVK